MLKMFIDSNRYLDFYRSKKDQLVVLDDIKKLSKHLLFPDQVYYEFMRNRSKLLKDLHKTLAFLKEKLIPPSFAVIMDNDNFTFLKESFDKSKDKIVMLQREVDEMIKKPDKDPVFLKLQEIYKDKQTTRLLLNDSIIKNAKKRNILGNPPKSKNGMCDEIVWETILKYSKTDLIIVSRDDTYSDNHMLLNDEYHKHTGKKIKSVTSKFLVALKALGEKARENLEMLENEQIKDINTNLIESIVSATPTNQNYGNYVTASTTLTRAQLTFPLIDPSTGFYENHLDYKSAPLFFCDKCGDLYFGSPHDVNKLCEKCKP